MDPKAHSELRNIFTTLARAGGAALSVPERSIYCDAQSTLFLHRPVTLAPYGNLPLYRLLHAFKKAGANVVVFSDQAMDENDPDIAALVSELKAENISDEVLRDPQGRLRVAAWNEAAGKCGVLIDDNQDAHHSRAHVYMHPADGPLHDMQDAARLPQFTINLPGFMKDLTS